MKSSQLRAIVLYQFSSKHCKKICTTHWSPKMEKIMKKYAGTISNMLFYATSSNNSTRGDTELRIILKDCSGRFPMKSNNFYHFYLVIIFTQLVYMFSLCFNFHPPPFENKKKLTFQLAFRHWQRCMTTLH